MDSLPPIAQARALLAQGRRRAAARLLLAEGSAEAGALLDTLPTEGGHGAVLAERLRFGPPETWVGWRRGTGKVAVKLWPQAVPLLALAPVHPCVAPLVACGSHWRVTAWVAGETLVRRLKREVTLDQALALLADLEESLAALHDAGLAHGDLNPANVVVTPEGRAALIDWGEPGVAEGAPARDRHGLAELAALLLTPRRAASRS